MGIKRDTLENGNVLRFLVDRFNKDQTDENFISVFRCLRDSFIWIPCNLEMSDADMEMFTNVLAENGLKLEAKPSSVDKEFKLDKNSLVYELKLQYEREKGAVGDKLETYIADNLSLGSSKDKVKQVDVSGLSNELVNMRKMAKGQQRA